jgi:hypothetical protein
MPAPQAGSIHSLLRTTTWFDVIKLSVKLYCVS